MTAFARYRKTSFPYAFTAELAVKDLRGGIPSDPRVAEAWIATKLGSKDDALRQQVAETMLERSSTLGEAANSAVDRRYLVGFKRDDKGLYIEGRQVKAAIKEAANVAAGAGHLGFRGWGKSNKGLSSFIAEHVHVVEDRIYLGCKEPSGVAQDFVHTYRGNSIQYSEYVDACKLTFTVETDWQFSTEEWARIWLAGERQGIGAARSQGHGRYVVSKWTAVR